MKNIVSLKRKHCRYKPGSVRCCFLQRACHLSNPHVATRLQRSTLHRSQRLWADNPIDDGIHELAAPRRHSPPIARRLVVSYTTFSPLLQTIWSGRSLLPDPAVANSFYFRKWSVLCCPDFPLVHQYLCTSDKPQQCFRVQRYCKRVEKQNKL